MVRLNHFRRADPALRAASIAVRQCPIINRSAIQRQGIVVSARKRAAFVPFSRPLQISHGMIKLINLIRRR